MKKLGFIVLSMFCALTGWAQNNTFPTSGNVGIGTTSPSSKLEIRQEKDPNRDRGLIISEPNNSQKIYLHLADNSAGEYGYLDLGGKTRLRGNGQPSSIDGRLGIGTAAPRHKLDVNGTVRAKEVRVEAAPWPDYVFEEGYALKPLTEVKQFIAEHQHLPEVPSAQEVKEKGIALGEMNTKLLQKIEELTLYMIEVKSEVGQLKAKNEALKNKVTQLEKASRPIQPSKSKK